MSLLLNQGTRPEGTEANMVTADYVDVGLMRISTADFCQLALYVLTNVDLVSGDPRLHFMNQLAKLNTIAGHNPGGVRLG